MLASPLLANAGPVVLLVIVGLVLVVGGVIYAEKKKRERREALQRWARKHGFDYTPDEVSSIEHRFDEFDDFSTGSERYGYNVVRGSERDRGVWAFDYHYETYTHDKNGRHTHHHHFSAVVIDSRLRLRPLFIRSEGFFDKLTQAVGFDDIDFESAEFSRKFYVKANDRRWAFDVIHQETMEWLLQAPRFQIRMAGPWVLVRRAGTLAPREFEDALSIGHGLLDRLPKDIVERLRRDAPGG